MIGTGRVNLRTLAVIFIAFNVNVANAANDPVVWYTPRVVPSYYYYTPLPVYSYYWVAPSYYCPSITSTPTPTLTAPPKAKIIPIDTDPDYAKPNSAPPSPSIELPRKRNPGLPAAKIENPLPDKAPVVIATRGMAGNYVPGATPLPKDRCRVGFWNVAGRDVILTIDGKNWTLPKNQSVTLDLERNFAWQVDQRTLQVERIPESQSTLELVIRD